MKLLSLAALAASACALHIPQRIEEFPPVENVGSFFVDDAEAAAQPIPKVPAGSAGPAGDMQTPFRASIDAKAANLLGKAQQVFGHAGEISSEVRAAWADMTEQLGDSLANLQLQSGPVKFSPRPANEWLAHVTNADLPNHVLRVKSPEDLGVDTVKQYSGYLDIVDEDKHFFYWFFESRNDPKNDPVILWLNGGPGCSSLTGLFFELGSSRISPELKPIHNPYSWNQNASVIYLDQPVNVGYSYSSSSVSNTVAAGKDVYALLTLFFQQFPEYNKQDFHIAGESYGGHYIPVFAEEILSHKERNFDIKSVLIGNGLTDPLTQYKYYQPMACGEGGAPAVLPEAECQAMLDTQPRCLSLIESCYDSESVFSCVPAAIYCNNAQMGPYQKTGQNVYDVRSKCEGNELCYKGLDYISDYLNQKEVMKALGAEVEQYESCNFDINRNFLFAGDWMKPYHRSVTTLLDAGIPVLIYAGDKDFICNWLGNHAWSDIIEWKKTKEFGAEPLTPWVVDGAEAGQVKNVDHFTFLRVYEAGHMVPYDQPENALAMVNTWIAGNYSFA